MTRSLGDHGVEFMANDFFLTPRELFHSWAASQKSYLMENFYRKQRVRLNVLMEGATPVGGSWNYDKENRKPPTVGMTSPPRLSHKKSAITTIIKQSKGLLKKQS